MRPPATILTATAATALVFAASAGLRVPDAHAAAPASRHHNAPSCSLVSPAEIESVLGVSVGKPRVTVNGAVTICTYGKPGGRHVIIRFSTSSSRQQFLKARKEFDAHGEPTKPVPSLHVPAYSSVLRAGTFIESTVVVLVGSTEVELTGPAPLAKMVDLAKKILPSL